MSDTPPTPLQTALLAWFDREARDLPWRHGEEGKRDPYRVWVSEVLLQQTQVSRGLRYYERFLEAFPTVEALAVAPLEAVLKAWEGCGYYARARHLHKAAGIVAKEGFPKTYEGWLTLPGVGVYTAAAIASLSGGEARAVGDGNVRRVLSRLHANKHPTDTWVLTEAQRLLHQKRPAAWNEALMDLGATICTPKPHCERCPLSEYCAAYKTGIPADFPAPKVRAAVLPVTAVALLIGDGQYAVLEQRKGKLLGGLFGLPMEEVTTTPEAALSLLCTRLNASQPVMLGTVTHVMTHRRITLHVYRAISDTPRTEVASLPLSKLDTKALALCEIAPLF